MTADTEPTKGTPKRRRGGPGFGQGRKPGSLTRLSRKRATEVADSGSAPIDIMLNNMHFWFGQAQELGERLTNLIVNVEDADERKEARALVKAFLAARENAQRCAVDAAPYVHPRLQAIAIRSATESKVEVTMTLPPTAEGEDRSYRNEDDEVAAAVAVNEAVKG